MTGAELKTLRDGKGWTQQQLADVLNQSLSRNYSSATVSAWELEKRKVPAAVVAFLDALPTIALAGDLDPPLAAGAAAPAGPQSPAREAGDQPPGPTSSPAAAPSLPGLSPSGAYATVCTELFEMLALGIGMVGAALGNHALVIDGQIIDADKVRLGRAYGRLAETNETFRKMLQGATSSGAWVEIAIVTSGTASAMLRSHVAIAQERAQNVRDLGAAAAAA